MAALDAACSQVWPGSWPAQRQIRSCGRRAQRQRPACAAGARLARRVWAGRKARQCSHPPGAGLPRCLLQALVLRPCLSLQLAARQQLSKAVRQDCER